MSNLFFTAAFTENGGDDPATGLTLAEIDLTLYSQNIATGALLQVWDGTQNPTAEVPLVGMYSRILAGADFSIYIYHGGADYTGAAVLDANYVSGSVGAGVFPQGPIDYTYTMYEVDLVTPISGVEVFISRLNPTGLVQDAPIIWAGLTNSAGVALDIEGNLPKLDVTTHYFWRQKTGYSFTDPDTETVS